MIWTWGHMLQLSESFNMTTYSRSWSGLCTLSVFEDYDSYIFSYRSHSWGSNQ